MIFVIREISSDTCTWTTKPVRVADWSIFCGIHNHGLGDFQASAGLGSDSVHIIVFIW